MLRSTFQHLKGISKKRESELWSRDILDWSDYTAIIGEQLTIFGDDETHHELTDSERAYNSGDMHFFKGALEPSEYYRVALEYPDEVLFLDIETTGLSLYYDQITIIGWSIGNNFGVYQVDGDEGLLFEALSKAKVIVTFNGTMFDLKFIEKHFGGITLPPIHIDLRYFSKRVGLTGGQKSIEKELGLFREGNIEDMLGEAAPVLWHRYRRGERKAMRRLIEYNHADVEGMKVILDESINRFYEREKIPIKIRVEPKFSKSNSRIKWARKPPKSGEYKILVEEFKGSSKPLITYEDLNRIYPIDNICIAGIDLVSSETRETGYCILRGDTATTSCLKTDEEMIDYAIESGVHLVSIDSPLSIPRGRTSYFDDDPNREYGITRLCERILKKRGVNSYPALIPSMQKLTKRGVELAKKFRSVGIPVIESYPGAAQDVMSIPRKQAGLKYLKDGMQEFGINGEYTEIDVSHDELDAITSAIVGQFYWTGMYERLGDEVEDYLIIPDLSANPEVFLNKKAIIISGEIAAGKTTIATYLEKRGYVSTRYSKVLEGILDTDGKAVNRSNLQKIGREVNEKYGQRWLGGQALALIANADDAVVDGIRFLEDVAFVRELYGPRCFHIHVDASEKIRNKRIRGKSSEDLSMKDAKKSKTESEISKLSLVANLIVNNDTTKKNLYSQIDDFLGRI